jgi:hypothetical protein
LTFLPPCLFSRQENVLDVTKTHAPPEKASLASSRRGFEYKSRAACRGASRCRWKDYCRGINPQYGQLFGYSEFKPVDADRADGTGRRQAPSAPPRG